MTDIEDLDISQELCAQVAAVAASGGQIEIIGGGSKRFYGEAIEALPIDVSEHSGIIDYDPAEMVITMKAGCKIREIKAVLDEQRQMFGFEPPSFSDQATIGGMLATGLAGPRRAYSGSIRDFVLGIKMLDGRGEILQFGGRVIKNVAGFDVSRVMVGALGTLGIILEVSLRVIPKFQNEVTLAFEQATAGEHIRWINELGSKPHPISASMWYQGEGRLRLSGTEQGVRQAVNNLGGSECKAEWDSLVEQSLPFFDKDLPLSRIAIPSAVQDILGNNQQLIEWGGAQRWLCGEVDIADLRDRVGALGGSVCAYQNHQSDVPKFHPLLPPILKLQRKIKSSFDPAGIFNSGRLYPEL
jgi:glycolate oxidase FAD binding subunit